MTAGSAAQVLLAWEEAERMHRGLRGAKFTATTLADGAPPGLGRQRGRAGGGRRLRLRPGARPAGGGRVLAAVSVSGPIERLARSPGRLHAAAVVAAGEKISELLRADKRRAAANTKSYKLHVPDKTLVILARGSTASE